MIDGLPMPVLVTRIADDRVILVNHEFTEAYGYATAEVTGREASALHYVEDDRRLTLERQASGDLASVEVRLRSAAGVCLWAQADVAHFVLDGTEDVLLTTFYDIGDRKRAEARAREGEALIAEMARFPKMNPGPVLRLRRDGTVELSNEAARAAFGEDIEGRCFWDACPDFSVEARERAVVGHQPIHEDVQVGDGWFALKVVPPEDSDHIFVFGSDISVQKRAERELEERARFPAMNPGPVARLSPDGTVIRANPAASRLFGFDDIRGMSWLELCPGIEQSIWDRVFSGVDFVQYEADTGVRCYSFTLRHEPVGNQVFLYGSDVTALKSAERALAELARFPDMNPGPVCRLDLAGRVLLANPAAHAVFGSDDLQGENWLELLPTVSGEFWDRVLRTGEAEALEARIGGRHYVLTHAPGPEGVFIFVYGSDITRQKEAEQALRQSEKMATLGTLAAGVAHELNNPAAAAQRAAAQLAASFASLQGAQAELTRVLPPGDVAALVSEMDEMARGSASCRCDLGPLARSDLEMEVEDWLAERGASTPWEIAPILVEGGLDLDALAALAERTGSEHVGMVAAWHAHAQQVYRLLDEIQVGTGRVSEIVGAMKAYSYLGQAPLQDVDVNEGLRSTLVILRSKLKAHITVHQELAADLPRIEAYGSELNQVWTNLIDNAADAMGGRGQIWVRSVMAGDAVVVEIEDDGPGIPPEIQGRVFDAFFTTKPPGKGTGLGLNTAYKIVVDKHDGAISVDSGPGRTCFRVRLPLVRRAVESSGGGDPG